MFVGIAATLALASGVAVAAGSLGQGQAKPKGWVSKDGSTAVVSGEGEIVAGLEGDLLEPEVRRLAVLAGHGSQLGVTVRDLDAEQAKLQNGAVVEDVREGSAASKAGIQKGDVIAEFDGERVRGVRHLTQLVSETPDGRTVKAAVVRDGKRVDLSVTPESGSLASWERKFDVMVPPMRFEGRREGGPHWTPGFPEGGWAFKGRPGEIFGFASEKGRLGLRIQSLDGQLGEYFGAAKGVLVNAVDADSPAAKAGLKAGDVVNAINGKAVEEPSELIEAVREAEDGATLTIDYVRDKKPQSTKAALPAEEKVETKPRRRVSPI